MKMWYLNTEPPDVSSVMYYSHNMSRTQQCCQMFFIFHYSDLKTRVIKEYIASCVSSNFSMFYQDFSDALSPSIKPERGEQLIVSAPRIILKLEGGTGNKTVPLLVAELEVGAEVKDWSSKVCLLNLKTNIHDYSLPLRLVLPEQQMSIIIMLTYNLSQNVFGLGCFQLVLKRQRHGQAGILVQFVKSIRIEFQWHSNQLNQTESEIEYSGYNE